MWRGLLSHRASSNRFRQYFMAGLTFIRWSVNMRSVDSFAKFACLLVLEIQKKTSYNPTNGNLSTVNIFYDRVHASISHFTAFPSHLSNEKKGKEADRIQPRANKALTTSSQFLFCFFIAARFTLLDGRLWHLWIMRRYRRSHPHKNEAFGPRFGTKTISR